MAKSLFKLEKTQTLLAHLGLFADVLLFRGMERDSYRP